MVNTDGGTRATDSTEGYLVRIDRVSGAIFRYLYGIIKEEMSTETQTLEREKIRVAEPKKKEIKKNRRNNKAIPPKRRDMKF